MFPNPRYASRGAMVSILLQYLGLVCDGGGYLRRLDKSQF